eukprot:1141591-Pelagomonas_calceolata.AAC.5
MLAVGQPGGVSEGRRSMGVQGGGTREGLRLRMGRCGEGGGGEPGALSEGEAWDVRRGMRGVGDSSGWRWCRVAAHSRVPEAAGCDSKVRGGRGDWTAGLLVQAGCGSDWSAELLLQESCGDRLRCSRAWMEQARARSSCVVACMQKKHTFAHRPEAATHKQATHIESIAMKDCMLRVI